VIEQPRLPQLGIDTVPPLTKPYLDSSVFLAHIKKESNLCPGGLTRYEITQGIFHDAKDGKFKIYTSTITIAEVRRLKEANKQLTLDERKEINSLFREYMEHEWIYPIEVNREIAEKAQELGATYSIWPMDAIHVASAIWWQCNTLLVWDKRTLFNKIPNGQIEGVRICEPYWEGTTKIA